MYGLATAFSEPSLDRAVERILFAPAGHYWLLIAGPFGLGLIAFLTSPNPVTAMALLFGLIVTCVTQLCWVAASNRWLLKTALVAPVFEIRKYDLLFCIMLISAVLSSPMTVLSTYQLTAQPQADANATGYDAIYDSSLAALSFFNFIFLAAYAVYLIITTVAAVKAERRLLKTPTSHVIKLLSYIYLPITIHFMRRRHMELRDRIVTLESAKNQ